MSSHHTYQIKNLAKINRNKQVFNACYTQHCIKREYNVTFREAVGGLKLLSPAREPCHYDPALGGHSHEETWLPVLCLHTERIKGILLYNCLSEKAMETREMLKAMLVTANRAVYASPEGGGVFEKTVEEHYVIHSVCCFLRPDLIESRLTLN